MAPGIPALDICVRRHQSFIGTGAAASFGLADAAGGSSGVALFDPETGASSAGASFASTGAATSAGALAESVGADSAGVLFASGVWLDMAAGPPSGTLLASTDVGATGCLFELGCGRHFRRRLIQLNRFAWELWGPWPRQWW